MDIQEIVNRFINAAQCSDTTGMTFGDFISCYEDYQKTGTLRLPEGVDVSCRSPFRVLFSAFRVGNWEEVELSPEQRMQIERIRRKGILI